LYYKPRECKGDIAIVVRLKRRLEKPEDIKNVKLEDLEFYVMSYENDRVQNEPPTYVIYTLPIF